MTRERVILTQTALCALCTLVLSRNMVGSRYPSVRTDATIALVLSAGLLAFMLGLLIYTALKGRRRPAG